MIASISDINETSLYFLFLYLTVAECKRVNAYFRHDNFICNYWYPKTSYHHLHQLYHGISSTKSSNVTYCVTFFRGVLHKPSNELKKGINSPKNIFHKLEQGTQRTEILCFELLCVFLSHALVKPLSSMVVTNKEICFVKIVFIYVYSAVLFCSLGY